MSKTLAKAVYDLIAERWPDSDYGQWWQWLCALPRSRSVVHDFGARSRQLVIPDEYSFKTWMQSKEARNMAKSKKKGGKKGGKGC